jgi:hypothetical protein
MTYPDNIKCTIGNEEIQLTKEEFEELVDKLIENKWYITSVSYTFPGLDDLNDNNTAFTENVTIIGGEND